MGRDTSLIYFLKLVNKHVRLVYTGLPTKNETSETTIENLFNLLSYIRGSHASAT